MNKTEIDEMRKKYPGEGRKVYRITEMGENLVKMKDLKQSDMFRMDDPDGSPVTDKKGNTTWQVDGDPKIIINEYGEETWGVEVYRAGEIKEVNNET